MSWRWDDRYAGCYRMRADAVLTAIPDFVDGPTSQTACNTRLAASFPGLRAPFSTLLVIRCTLEECHSYRGASLRLTLYGPPSSRLLDVPRDCGEP